MYKTDISKVLSKVDYPAEFIVLDAETYFDETYSLSNDTIYSYVKDSRFEVLGWASNDGETKSWSQKLPDIDWERTTVIFHHAHFDAVILKLIHEIVPPYILDTRDLSRAWRARNSHALKDLAVEYHIAPKGETANFKGWTRRERLYTQGRNKQQKLRPIITDEMEKQLSEYAIHDTNITVSLCHNLLPRLANPKAELAVARSTLDMQLFPTLKFDYSLAKLLRQELEQEVKDAEEATGLSVEKLRSNIEFNKITISAIEASGGNIGFLTKEVKGGKNKPNKIVLAVAKKDKARKSLENHKDKRVRDLVKARLAIKSLPNHIARIEILTNLANAADGYVPIYINYHAAHTGRDSGGDGTNFQNLPKYGIFAKIRELLIAPPECTLVIGDEAQIEARGTAWLADETVLLDKFVKGIDVYADFASTIYNSPVRKGKKTDVPLVEQVMNRRRDFGKVAILGLGFGMGAKKFVDHVEQQTGQQISLQTAESVVYLYRQQYRKIPELWKNLEGLFRYTAKYRESREGPKGLKFSCSPDCDVTITLPNGREIHYHKVWVEASEHINVWDAKEKHWSKIYGGLLTENIVQAFSRDILMEAMLDLRRTVNLKAAMRVHDELVYVVSKNDTLAEDVIRARLVHVPSWAKGLPLAADVRTTDRYSK